VSKGLKILLVDDNEMLLSATADNLRHRGHYVTTAPNGLEALHALRYPFDIVITDLEMPGMCGDALCAAIKKRYPGTPVILVSGSRAVLDVPLGGEGPDGVLAKPYSSFDLRTIMESVIAERKAG
jgi:CheY-like chemotaxis protein